MKVAHAVVIKCTQLKTGQFNNAPYKMDIKFKYLTPTVAVIHKWYRRNNDAILTCATWSSITNNTVKHLVNARFSIQETQLSLVKGSSNKHQLITSIFLKNQCRILEHLAERLHTATLFFSSMLENLWWLPLQHKTVNMQGRGLTAYSEMKSSFLANKNTTICC